MSTHIDLNRLIQQNDSLSQLLAHRLDQVHHILQVNLAGFLTSQLFKVIFAHLQWQNLQDIFNVNLSAVGFALLRLALNWLLHSVFD